MFSRISLLPSSFIDYMLLLAGLVVYLALANEQDAVLSPGLILMPFLNTLSAHLFPVDSLPSASPLPLDKHKHSKENACLSPRDRLCSGVFSNPLDPTQVSRVEKRLSGRQLCKM